MNPVDDEEDIDVALIDTGRSKKVSKSRLEKTAMNHFNKFLLYSNNPYPNFDSIPEQNMQDSILGFFDDYLRKVVKNVQKYNTHSNYVSAIYNAIILKYPAKKDLFEREYNRVRASFLDYYASIARSTPDGNMTDHSLELKRHEYEYCCKVLMREGKYSLRAAFALDLFCGGRISEVYFCTLILQEEYLFLP